jgi:hypothetical protein
VKYMRRLSKIIFGFIAITSVLAIIPVNAQAASTNTAQGIQISPTLVDLNAARGKTYNITLTVTNVTASDLVYTSSINDFNAADETGSPHIILDSKLPATSSIITWMTTAHQFTLAAHKAMVVNAQITIPNNAEPGGHYGVLRFSGAAPELESTGVGLSASAGALILVRVDGAITEKASLVSFYTSQTQQGAQTSFFENGPISFITRIKNDGNIHIKPVGNIEVRDMFGNLVANLPVNNDKSNVLPNSIRRFDNAKLDNKWMFGLYTVNLTLGYGTTGQAITSTINFWVIPYKIVITILLALATIIYILIRLVKVYNKRIIERAKNESSTKNKKHLNKKG